MLYDISLPLTSDTPRYPGKLAPQREVLSEIASGDRVNSGRLLLDCHVGTHVDAPAHFVAGGETIEAVSLERLCGPCVVVEVTGRREILPDDLAAVPRGVRVLFKTLGSALLRAGLDDPRQLPYLHTSAAGRLVELGCPLVGIDAYSVDDFGGDELCHLILLPAGVLILECVDLSDVPAGMYSLWVLPLKFPGAEASPVRAVLSSPVR
jgi:arylformamidase